MAGWQCLDSKMVRTRGKKVGLANICRRKWSNVARVRPRFYHGLQVPLPIAPTTWNRPPAGFSCQKLTNGADESSSQSERSEVVLLDTPLISSEKLKDSPDSESPTGRLPVIQEQEEDVWNCDPGTRRRCVEPTGTQKQQ